jgi:CHAD domain-containing protein
MGLDLSTRRDQEVLSAMLSDWRKRSDVRRSQTLKNAVQQMHRQIGQTPSTSPSLDPSVEASIKRRFAHVSDTLNQADLESLSWDSLAKAARKRIARLKQARAAYLSNPSAEALHEWRKQLKNRLHHLKLLRKLGSPNNRAIKRVRKLEALLGSARDLDLLIDTLLNSTHTGLNVPELGALLTYAESQKEMRLRKALHQAGNKFLAS